MSVELTGQDRILVIAPHPDDEALATGGLILHAIKVGAAVRIIFATNGDNNPWPQRWVERRWRVGVNERKRWGAMRRREARAAIKCLGLPPGSARFLNFPDQGMTDKLLNAEPEVITRLCHELEDWKPTLLVFPSPHDLHPDHNALHVLFSIAMDRAESPRPRQLHYLVHCRRPDLVPLRLKLSLSEQERLTKRHAILCHKTQMVLSRKRFVAYAKAVELYHAPSPALELLDGHRIREAFIERGVLHLSIPVPPGRWKGSSIFVAAESPSGSLRWQLPIPPLSAKIRLRDTGTDKRLRHATIRIQGRCVAIKIPMPSSLACSRVFVKLHERTIFLDATGWREVPIAAPVQAVRTRVLR